MKFFVAASLAALAVTARAMPAPEAIPQLSLAAFIKSDQAQEAAPAEAAPIDAAPEDAASVMPAPEAGPSASADLMKAPAEAAPMDAAPADEAAASEDAVGEADKEEYVEPAAVPPAYSFGYSVKDEESGNDFGHKETRDGDMTSGSYHVLLPDGRLQVVTYTVSGDGGYQAEVTYV